VLANLSQLYHSFLTEIEPTCQKTDLAGKLAIVILYGLYRLVQLDKNLVVLLMMVAPQSTFDSYFNAGKFPSSPHGTPYIHPVLISLRNPIPYSLSISVAALLYLVRRNTCIIHIVY